MEDCSLTNGNTWCKPQRQQTASTKIQTEVQICLKTMRTAGMMKTGETRTAIPGDCMSLLKPKCNVGRCSSLYFAPYLYSQDRMDRKRGVEVERHSKMLTQDFRFAMSAHIRLQCWIKLRLAPNVKHDVTRAAYNTSWKRKVFFFHKN